ncbi:uncharacterized protein LOC127842109 isoform X1 [Dreissena polymorpha]|uniref:uncharacterized protein LOC127842109 isoform X1 n=1 Tax=Dreissena polymorpha TaxID=45954 RepID=UPI00226562AC|nr:uncharacterized protein LOC127842109 isoform X1 [Dreissena polymorpha]
MQRRPRTAVERSTKREGLERTQLYLSRDDAFGQAMRNVHGFKPMTTTVGYDQERRGKTYSSADFDTELSDTFDDLPGQHMKQTQLRRSKEASKQMLYAVFSNAMAILEQFETRESPSKNLQKSFLYIPDQRGKSDEDIRSILETQVLLFETQAKSCPSYVRAEVGSELRRKVLEWMAVRADKDCNIEDTDMFAAQMYEVLVTGRTTHAFHSRTSFRRPHSAATIRESMPHILGGLHSARQLDEDFRTHEEKKAVRPETRRSSSRKPIKAGAKRILHCKPALKTQLEDDVEQFEGSLVDVK